MLWVQTRILLKRKKRILFIKKGERGWEQGKGRGKWGKNDPNIVCTYE
jgi:hypothetical protein